MMRHRPRSFGIPVSVDVDATHGFPSSLANQTQDREGMTYAMLFAPRVIGAPTVPEFPRQSLGQVVLRYRVQASRYFSIYRGGGSLSRSRAAGAGLPGSYKTARGHTIINTAPTGLSARPGPVTSGRAPARPGTMASPPRFRKALRLPVNNFNPPTY